MSTEIAVAEQKSLTAGEIRAHVNRVQEVMQAVMKKGTHYGVIPGSKKPSLYKPGAEVLCATFRIAPSYRVEDMSTGDSIRYRITAIGTHQMSGVVLGEGIGECSSNEEKYKWRAAICTEEFDETPPDRRRIKYAKWNNKVEKKQQVRTEPSDSANTVLKMAAKRAQVAMTLNVTAASDCFTQDIEDLPEHLRDTEDSHYDKQIRQTGTQAAQVAKPEIVNSPERDALIARLELLAKTAGVEAYTAEFKAIGKEGRAMVGTDEHQRLWDIANTPVNELQVTETVNTETGEVSA